MNLAAWLPPLFMRERRAAEQWNALLSHAGRPLPLAGKTSFQFAAVDPPDESTSGLVIDSAQGPRLTAVVKSFPFKAMFGSDIEMPEVQQLAPSLRDCINEGVVATLWKAIPDQRMGAFRIVAAGPLSEIRNGAAPSQWVTVTLQGVVPEPVTVVLGFDVSAFIDAVAGGSLPVATVANGIRQRIPSEAFITLGHMRLTVGELRGLAAGDVIVVPDMPADQVMVRAEGNCYVFRRAAQGFACVKRDPVEYERSSPAREEGLAMSEKGEPAPKGKTEPALDGLGLVIDFDLGRVTLPLGAVQAWQPGTVVALEQPVLTDGVEVTIRANGQVIGLGDLVRIDDRIAVRLTRVSIGGAP